MLMQINRKNKSKLKKDLIQNLMVSNLQDSQDIDYTLKECSND